MHVAVGSENPVKLAATEAALRGREPTVESVPVDPGVQDQPRGHAETIAGAQNRAESALAFGPEVDLSVGIEGGVAELRRHQGGDRTWADEVARVSNSSDLFLVMWAAASDGIRMARGSGPAIRLPERVANRVRDGQPLGPVVDDLVGTDDVGRGQGAAGVLTDGIVDRESALEQAIAGALGPFVTDHY
jgi:inosine/xanthosine triphosphatase